MRRLRRAMIGWILEASLKRPMGCKTRQEIAKPSPKRADGAVRFTAKKHGPLFSSFGRLSHAS